MDLNEALAFCPIEGRETPFEEICQVSFGRIVRLQPSGLIRFYPPRSAQALSELHASPTYFEHPYFEARRDLSRETLVAKHRDLLKRIAAGGKLEGLRLLDVGCDTGALLLVGRDEFGMQVAGVEVSPAAVNVAGQQGLEVHQGLIQNLDLPHNRYDIITLIDVIEHVSNPADLVCHLYRLLKTDGKLYIATADHDALINAIGLWLYHLVGQRAGFLLEKLYIPYHEYYFTQATLAALIQRCGFEVHQHHMREFPLDEFGHGWLLKLALIPTFWLQKLLRRQTLQEMIAIKK